MNSEIRSAHEIRRAYIDFFIERDHTEVPSAPLAPKGDPTLLFTSAGMVQFKDNYLDPGTAPYRRATSVQKCLRAGDLESVGKTLRHHTFFEMLGNFSFGDYFKREAIVWGWEFVIELLQLDPEKLMVSVFEDDDEAHDIWNREIGIAGERIYRLGRDDNFWGPVGATGICGPSSEIYYDTGPERSCGSKDCAPGCDCDRYIEFWNLVFPQFFLEESGEYRRLEKPGIDTGLGLERLAMIMQGVEDNFHTDLFSPIVENLASMVPKGATMGPKERMGLNMIADHTRALTFTVSEGIYPSNEGRGYLLRRLLRRALTRFHSFGIEKPSLYKLVDLIVEIMKDDYPELVDRRKETAKIVKAEEKAFFRTLEEGRARFHAIVGETREAGLQRIDGEKVFVLYDTFGLPLELTRSLAEAEGLGIDEDGFEVRMEEQRRRAQEGSAFSEREMEQVEMIEVGSGESSRFTGYERLGGDATVMKYRLLDKSGREDIAWGKAGGKAVEIVLDSTPFYAVSGGQVSDKGWIEIEGTRFEVVDVLGRGSEIVHLLDTGDEANKLEKVLSKGPKVRVQIDDERRLSVARNHTATHLLHAALRSVVGKHVTQAGSLVDAERLRFDFSHFEQITREERSEIERMVNGWIMDAIDVKWEWMGHQEALESGAMALFDEKYGAKVRVVRIPDVSIELCGGTHVQNTGQIGSFFISSESSAAAGIRRIEAVTGMGALDRVRSIVARGEEIGLLLKSTPDESPHRIRTLLEEMDSLKRELKQLERGGVSNEIDGILKAAKKVDGILIAFGRVRAKDVSALRNQADIFRNKVDSGVAVLSAQLKGKMQFVVTVTDDIIGKGSISATGIVRELEGIAGGGGGGKDHLAQLGTKDLDSEERVFEALPEIIKRLE
jgi:alanyl-tRNA synthetase